MSKWALGFHFSMIQLRSARSVDQIRMNFPMSAEVIICSILALIRASGSLILGRFSDLGMEVLVLMASRLGWVVDDFARVEHSVVFGSG